MPFDINNFQPTHTIGGVLAQRIDDPGRSKYYYDATGKQIYAGKGRPLAPYTPPPPPPADLFPGPETIPLARLHAAAATCVLMAATLPEWPCAHGSAQSARGDSATCDPNQRGPNGEKIVRLCEVSPGRISKYYDVLVPEYMSFEVIKR